MRSILVVATNPHVRRALIVILGRRGCTVDAVEGVEAGLNFLRQPARSLVLLDWPGDPTCLLILTAMRNHSSWGLVPVVMIAGREAKADEIAHAFGLGANDYLSDPFSADLVTEKLDRFAARQIEDFKKSGLGPHCTGQGRCRLPELLEVIGSEDAL